jgi:EF hand
MTQPDQQQMQSHPMGQEDAGTMGHGRMTWRDMMGEHMTGRGMMGGGAMGPPIMFRMMFALMDADGDGTISLQEFQAAHERISKAMDSNKDGKLTMEEMQAFMHGPDNVPARAGSLDPAIVPKLGPFFEMFPANARFACMGFGY